MIQLTKDIIAVEVPNNARLFHISNNGKIEVLEGYPYLEYKDDAGFDWIKLNKSHGYSLIGVTPLSEEQAELIVEWIEDEQYYRDYRKDGWQGDIPAIQSFATLLESKGLDVNKKYAIIKIEGRV